jgi:hypothetical protein
MTPKEKAEDLVDRYYWTFGDGYLGEQHIQCALIAVDEIIASNPIAFDEDDNCIAKHWWQEVKTEIENK